jgi:hypothetical protein
LLALLVLILHSCRNQEQGDPAAAETSAPLENSTQAADPSAGGASDAPPKKRDRRGKKKRKKGRRSGKKDATAEGGKGEGGLLVDEKRADVGVGGEVDADKEEDLETVEEEQGQDLGAGREAGGLAERSGHGDGGKEPRETEGEILGREDADADAPVQAIGRDKHGAEDEGGSHIAAGSSERKALDVGGGGLERKHAEGLQKIGGERREESNGEDLVVKSGEWGTERKVGGKRARGRHGGKLIKSKRCVTGGDEPTVAVQAGGDEAAGEGFHTGEEQLEKTEEDGAVDKHRRRGAENGGQPIRKLDVGDRRAERPPIGNGEAAEGKKPGKSGGFVVRLKLGLRAGLKAEAKSEPSDGRGAGSNAPKRLRELASKGGASGGGEAERNGGELRKRVGKERSKRQRTNGVVKGGAGSEALKAVGRAREGREELTAGGDPGKEMGEDVEAEPLSKRKEMHDQESEDDGVQYVGEGSHAVDPSAEGLASRADREAIEKSDGNADKRRHLEAGSVGRKGARSKGLPNTRRQPMSLSAAAEENAPQTDVYAPKSMTSRRARSRMRA